MTAEPAARPTPTLRRERQLAQYRRALKTLPGGANSNFRTWGEDTVYVDRGKGGRVWDQDGNEFIDLRMGYGPVILGHGDDRVDDHVNERMRKGVSFSLTSEDEIRAMELLKELNPWVDKARMTVSGTEATMHAMRIARAYTGRTKIVKFEGQYHGVHDYALISVGAQQRGRPGRRATTPSRLAWGRGIPAEVARTMIPARYNNIDFLRRLFEREGEDIAAIIVEPVLGNAAGILPQPGFHQAMRALTEEFGILLIFDEVKTGFRFAKGGAAEYFGITPDLATYAKAMGNGYPAAAFGGRDEVMERPARQGQPRRHLRRQPRRGGGGRQDARDPPRHRRARRPSTPTGERIQAGVRELLDAKGLAVPPHRAPLDVRRSCSPTGSRPSTATGPTRTTSCTTQVAVGMHARGAMPEPDSREPWFMCEAHAQGDIVDRVITIFGESLDAALDARAHGERRRRARRGRDVQVGRRLTARRTGGRSRPMTLDGNAVRSVDRAAALLLALGRVRRARRG